MSACNGKFIFDLRGYLHGIRVKLVYEGHRVKVEVTAAKGAKFPIPAMQKLCVVLYSCLILFFFLLFYHLLMK